MCLLPLEAILDPARELAPPGLEGTVVKSGLQLHVGAGAVEGGLASLQPQQIPPLDSIGKGQDRKGDDLPGGRAGRVGIPLCGEPQVPLPLLPELGAAILHFDGRARGTGRGSNTGEGVGGVAAAA